jgi:hypothetical protein
MLIELMTEAVFVGVFEQAWAQPCVHAHRQADDAAGQAVGVGNAHVLSLGA